MQYPDHQGTVADEKEFLRLWIDSEYLWYNEVPTNLKPENYATPIDYFAVLKTPLLTASGKPKDKFHFTYPSAVWDALNAQGTELGYGVTWQRNTDAGVPRIWLATTIEPGSPAEKVGIQRGDALVSVDGIDFVNATSAADVALINAGLFPVSSGESHHLVINSKGSTSDLQITSANVPIVPVKYTRTFDTPTGKVGYFAFVNHNQASESLLMDAITTLKTAGVNDLVLDLRYNGGGLLVIADELAYMIAGPGPTTGKVFEQARYNDKQKPAAPMLFSPTAYGFLQRAGEALPYLGLKRVTVLTTAGTCSASESIINSLRGVDVQVDLIGGTTCGKPYAFTPVPNCGTTYFAINFQGVNNKGFGDYPDGFTPACSVADDLTHAVGDPAEGLLSAALAYRSSGRCAANERARVTPMVLVRPQAAEISVYSPRR